jgi:beta-glucanase (GH16 family)
LQKLLLFFSLFVVSCKSAQKNILKTRLVWSDEFSHPGLPDSTKWSYDVGCHGWGNNELQCYTEKRSENARVENGNLIIEARKENYNEKKYTSARLISKGKGDWKYGRVEVNAKIPKGAGTWPAIWMLASTTPLKWPDDGEIDMMEHVGFDQGNIHAAIHSKKYNHGIGTQKTAIMPVPDCTDNFHIYALDWTPDTIKISVDNKVYFTFGNEHTDSLAWPFNEPFHLLLNIAIGGNWGGQKGIVDSIFPARMEVDYVRVYK